MSNIIENIKAAISELESQGHYETVPLNTQNNLSIRDLRGLIRIAEHNIAEADRLSMLINTPETEDFASAVVIEAAHQRERWGDEHDAGKGAYDWHWTLAHLSQKACVAFEKGDHEKAKHHCISSAALMANFHRHIQSIDKSDCPEPGGEKISDPVAGDIDTLAIDIAPKSSTLSSEEIWWLECLRRGRVAIEGVGALEWQLVLPKTDVYTSYENWARKAGQFHPTTEEQFGKKLLRICPDIEASRRRLNGDRTYVYLFPSLKHCRDVFTAMYGSVSDWNHVEGGRMDSANPCQSTNACPLSYNPLALR